MKRKHNPMETAMFTVDKLLNIAIDAEAARDAIKGVVGVSCDENKARYELHRKMQDAMLCAQHMEHNGITELKYVGPFGVLPFKAGDKVRIKKGAKIGTTHPKFRGTEKFAGTSHTVVAHDVFGGWVGRDHDHHNGGVDLRQPVVHWAGQGGYWCWTDASNVEAIA